MKTSFNPAGAISFSSSVKQTLILSTFDALFTSLLFEFIGIAVNSLTFITEATVTYL